MEVKVHISVNKELVNDFFKVLDHLNIKYQCLNVNLYCQESPVKIIDINEILSSERESLIKNIIQKKDHDL